MKLINLFPARWALLRDSMFILVAQFVFNIASYVIVIAMGRMLSVIDFAVLALVSSFFFILQIPGLALSNLTQRYTAYLSTKPSLIHVFKVTSRLMIVTSVLISLLYLISIPFMSHFFRLENSSPLWWFLPTVIFTFVLSWIRSYFSGLRFFTVVTVSILLEGFVKIIASLGLVMAGFGLAGAIFAFPISIIAGIIPGIFYLRKTRPKKANLSNHTKTRLNHEFSTYYAFALISSFGLMLLSSIDVILIKHLIDPVLAGTYALLTIFGKIILLGAGAFSGVALPHIVASLNNRNQFLKLVGLSLLLIGGYTFGLALIFNLLPQTLAQILIGNRSSLIVDFLPRYSIAVALLSISSFVISLQIVQRKFIFALIPLFFSLLLGYLLWIDHDSLYSIVTTYQRSALAMFAAVFAAFFAGEIKWYLSDFTELFRFKISPRQNSQSRILIFNWRDTKHTWSGGAEVYIHELAKRWVISGHQVTMFCGNDRQNLSYENIDGVEIVRRGGFVSVYLWAWLYYWLKLRHQTDIIVDCENGIPFFTPLYANKPIILLIHHVHLDVFKQNLNKPFAALAIFLETKFMPWVYRHAKLATISNSTKKAISELGFRQSKIHIFVSGVDGDQYHPGPKSTSALVSYVGRLKAYKNLPTFLRAAKLLLLDLPYTKFVIAGSGEELTRLKELSKNLGIKKQVKFLGKISQSQKVALYQKSWVTVNPSFMEGFGITSIESSACGTPVIASDVPGLRDSVKHGYSGYLTSYGNSRHMAQKMYSILTNRHIRSKLSTQAVKYSQQFDWQVSADEFLKLLSSQHQTASALNPKWLIKRIKNLFRFNISSLRGFAGGKNA